MGQEGAAQSDEGPSVVGSIVLWSSRITLDLEYIKACWTPGCMGALGIQAHVPSASAESKRWKQVGAVHSTNV